MYLYQHILEIFVKTLLQPVSKELSTPVSLKQCNLDWERILDPYWPLKKVARSITKLYFLSDSWISPSFAPLVFYKKIYTGKPNLTFRFIQSITKRRDELSSIKAECSLNAFRIGGVVGCIRRGAVLFPDGRGRGGGMYFPPDEMHCPEL